MGPAVTTAPPNGIGFTVFATERRRCTGCFGGGVVHVRHGNGGGHNRKCAACGGTGATEPEIVAEVRGLVTRAWAQARRCEDCGAESGESCRWPCLGRPEETEDDEPRRCVRCGHDISDYAPGLTLCAICEAEDRPDEDS